MCAEQLSIDRNVSSQMEAAEALATFHTCTSIEALSRALRDHTTFYRVRAAAAESLGALVEAKTEYLALDRLIGYVHATWFDGGVPRPSQWADLAEYEVLKAVIRALGHGERCALTGAAVSDSEAHRSRISARRIGRLDHDGPGLPFRR